MIKHRAFSVTRPLSYYELALQIDPENLQARTGIEKLEQRYIQLAKHAEKQKKLIRPKRKNALYYYSQARDINKNSIAADKGIKALVDRYIKLAETAKEAHKILTPKGSSAIDYYQRALQIDSHSYKAQEGIANLATHYSLLASTARKKRMYKRMEIYVDRGLTVDPYNTRLIKMKSEARKLRGL
ncbi:MAG: hypothetical protein HRU20_30610 [Pseudomonadales bacterium]|nr:hypothetical protein [Pseudomonadales bacterium]